MPHLAAAMTQAMTQEKNNIQHIPPRAAHILISDLSDVANNNLNR